MFACELLVTPFPAQTEVSQSRKKYREPVGFQNPIKTPGGGGTLGSKRWWCSSERQKKSPKNAWDRKYFDHKMFSSQTSPIKFSKMAIFNLQRLFKGDEVLDRQCRKSSTMYGNLITFPILRSV